MNTLIVCANAMVEPGDAIVAVDSGVVVVPTALVKRTAEAAAARKANEGSKCAKPRSDVLGLDLYRCANRSPKRG